MVFDLVALGIVLALAAIGAWRGAAESGLRLVGWVCGYVAATYAGFAGGERVARALEMPTWLGIPLVGTVAFLVIQLVVAVTIAWVRRRRRESEPGGVDRALGAAFGAARGTIVAIVLGWLGLWLEGLAASGVALPFAPAEGSLAARASGAVVEQAGTALLGSDDAGARVAVAFAARPRETIEALRGVTEAPTFAALQRDSEFWSAIEAGESARALAQPSFRALLGDAALRARFVELGLVDRAAAQDPRAFEVELRAALDQVGGILARMRSDPEMRALLEDPEVQALVERRDALGLLMHPRFRSVVQRASAS